MDAAVELKLERERRIKLEEELSLWHKQVLDELTPEERAVAVQTQQLEGLTYHLLRSQKALEAKQRELGEKDEKLREALGHITSLEEKIRSLEERNSEAEHSGQDFGVGELPSDKELDFLLHEEKPEDKPKRKRTLRDFLLIMKRMRRIKMLDASILLDVDSKTILQWSTLMSKKGYLRMEGGGEDRVLIAKDRLLRAL